MSSLGQLKNERQMISEKLLEMEMELEEHQVVIGALEPLDKGRRCHRLIGGVLVERTVAEVLPALERNKTGVHPLCCVLRSVYIHTTYRLWRRLRG